MFDLWIEHATKRSNALGLTYDALIKSHDVVRSAMGQEWIDRQEERRGRPQSTLAHAHPLFTALGSSTDQALIEIAELALYLKEFKSDPMVGQTLANLRAADKYGATLFELAMAYRWRTAGASVSLEPATPLGRLADFDATIGSVRYVIECSGFPANVFATDEMAFTQFLMSRMPNFDLSVTLEVEVERVPEGDFFGSVAAALKSTLRSFAPRSQVTSMSTDFGKVTLRKTDTSLFNASHPLADGRWTTAARLSLHAANPDGTKYGIHLTPDTSEEGWILVRFPDDRPDPYAALARKFKHEYEQLSGVEEPRVILLDATVHNANALTFNVQKLNDSVGQALLGKPKVAGLWVMSRTWTTRSRFQYRSIVINNPNSPDPLPREFIELLGDREHSLCFLTGKTWTGDAPEKPGLSFL